MSRLRACGVVGAAVVVAVLAATGAAPAQGWHDHLTSSPPVHGVALQADIDGDGRPNRAAVHCRPGGVPLLVVSTAHGVITRPLRTTGCGVNARVVALAEIDRVPGAEVVVLEASGSAFFARVYTLRNRRLVLMNIQRAPVPLLEDAFAYGRAVAHDASVDCVRRASGEVVVSLWGLDLERQGGVIVRKYLHVVGTHFRLVRTKRFFVLGDHRRYDGFGEPELFPSCAVARAPGS